MGLTAVSNNVGDYTVDSRLMKQKFNIYTIIEKEINIFGMMPRNLQIVSSMPCDNNVYVLCSHDEKQNYVIKITN